MSRFRFGQHRGPIAFLVCICLHAVPVSITLDAATPESSASPKISGRVWIDDTPQPAPGARVSLFGENGALLASTASGPQGEYEFSDIAPGEYYVFAQLRDRISHPVISDSPLDISRVARGVDPAPLNLQLRTGSALRGTVRNYGDDSPFPGATVRASYKQATLETLSGPDGVFRFEALPEGFVEIRAESPGRAPAVLKPEAPLLGIPYDFSIDDPAPLRIQAFDSDGRPVVGAEVSASGLAQYDERGRTGLDGVCVIDPAPRSILLTLNVRKGRMHGGGNFRLADSPETIRIEMRNDPSEAAFEGFVRDPAGNPLPGVEVGLTYNHRLDFDSENTATSGPDGSYRFEISDLLDSPGRLLVALAPDREPAYASFAMPATPNPVVRKDFTVGPGRFVEVLFVDDRGAPAEGVEAVIAAKAPPDIGNSETGGAVKSGPDGKVRAAGLFSTAASVSTKNDVFLSVSDVPLVFDSQTTIQLTPAKFVKGRVIHAGAQTPIEQFAISHKSNDINSIDRDRFHPNGEFWLKADPQDSGPIEVRIAALGYAVAVKSGLEFRRATEAETVVFELVKADPLKFQFVSAIDEKPIANARIRLHPGRIEGPFQWAPEISEERPRRDLRTGLQGEFDYDIAEPFECLGVDAPGFARTIQSRDRIEALPIGSDGRRILRIQPPSSISGIALLDGAPIANAEIVVSVPDAVRAGSPTPTEASRAFDEVTRRTPNFTLYPQYFDRLSTGPDGSFRIDRLSAGLYVVAVAGPISVTKYVVVGDRESVIVDLAKDVPER